MAEVMTNVHDILFPSPPALKEIVYISIAEQLWRQEINAHRIKNTLSELNLERNILASSSAPGLPATDLSVIEKNVKRLGLSIKQWLQGDFPYRGLFKKEILNDFIDFAVNFDGLIHYVRTAKRIVLCDKIEQILRFKTACTFCFEDDITRIWPSVSSHADLKSMSFNKDSLLYYWICKLKNQLYKLPRSANNNPSIEERILDRLGIRLPWTTVEYFWNCSDAHSRVRILTEPSDCFYKSCRYLLSRFNEVELNRFANVAGWEIIFASIRSEEIYYYLTLDNDYIRCGVCSRATTVLHTMLFWTFIKNGINESMFFSLVRKIIRKLRDGLPPIDMSTCCELWKTAKDDLKLHAIQQLLLENSLFRRTRKLGVSDIDGSFLLTVLSDASTENRSTFWNRNWRSLIDVMCSKDFDQLMRLCFGNDENEIVEFKLNTLSAFANVRVKCSRLLNNILIKELNEFLTFCYPDEQTRKNIRLNLLVEEFKVHVNNIPKVSSLLNDFINNSYDDANLAADFKTQLLFSPSTKATFTELIDSHGFGYQKYHHDIKFIDILAPTEQIARDLKRLYFLPLLKQKLLISNIIVQNEENAFSNFIREFSSNEEETRPLKETLSVDDIVQHVIRSAMFARGGPKYNSFLVQFLEWYFITPQALGEFKAKYADDDVFVQLTTE